MPSRFRDSESRGEFHVRRILVFFIHNQALSTLRASSLHHLRALDAAADRCQILYYNCFLGAPAWLRWVRPDAVIYHTSFLANRYAESKYFEPWRRRLRWMADLTGVKIAVPQDEYDHSEILDEWLEELRVHAIFTNFDAASRSLLYPRLFSKAAFHECLTGYMDESAIKKFEGRWTPLSSRPRDIVYRAKQLPYWFGSHGQLKHRIGEIVAQKAASHGLVCDISVRPEDTIVGDAWLDFLASGRTVIGCEGGSSALDRRGELRSQIRSLLERRPGAALEEIHPDLPEGWDDYRFFAASPRHLEAVVTKTCQILVEGSYNEILEPHKHYLPLKRDGSNFTELVEKIRDVPLLQTIVDRSYEDHCRSERLTYTKFAQDLERAIDLTGVPTSSRTSWDRMVWTLSRTAAKLKMSRTRVRTAFFNTSFGRCLRRIKNRFGHRQQAPS